jgi:hypothetical protein
MRTNLTLLVPRISFSSNLPVSQSRALETAKNLLFGRRSVLDRLFTKGNTVSIHEHGPYQQVRPMTWGPFCIQISPERETSLSLKSQVFRAMLYPKWVQKLSPINLTKLCNCEAVSPALGISVSHNRRLLTMALKKIYLATSLSTTQARQMEMPLKIPYITYLRSN